MWTLRTLQHFSFFVSLYTETSGAKKKREKHLKCRCIIQQQLGFNSGSRPGVEVVDLYTHSHTHTHTHTPSPPTVSLNCWHNSPASSREPPPQQEVESDAAALNRKFANSPACYHIYFMLYTVHRCTHFKTLQRTSSRMLNDASTRGSRSISRGTPPPPCPRLLFVQNSSVA